MKATKCQLQRPLRGRYGGKNAALLAALLLTTQCSSLPPESPTQEAPPANYGAVVSGALKNFKDFSGYSNFAVSGLRWVHVATGWNWLACVRFDDRGRQLYYSFFIKDNTIVAGRYDVRTDRCRVQQYLPLNVATGEIAAASAPVEPTPGTAGAPTLLQGPIY